MLSYSFGNFGGECPRGFHWRRVSATRRLSLSVSACSRFLRMSVLANHFNIREVDGAGPTCAAPQDAVSQPRRVEDAEACGSAPSLAELRACLCGPSAAGLTPGPAPSPVAKVMRAIYYLRTMGGDDAIDVLCDALRLRAHHSPLLRHEIGYVLGQMQSERSCEALEAVLVDVADDVMVRHECAEALGAIGAARSIDLLDRMADPARMVALSPPPENDSNDSITNDVPGSQRTSQISARFSGITNSS